VVLAVAHHPLGGRLASASSYLSSQSLANSRSDLHALRGLPTLDLVVLSPAPSGRDGDGRTDGTPPPHRFCCAVYFRGRPLTSAHGDFTGRKLLAASRRAACCSSVQGRPRLQASSYKTSELVLVLGVQSVTTNRLSAEAQSRRVAGCPEGL